MGKTRSQGDLVSDNRLGVGTDSIGIGTTNPIANIEVRGDAKIGALEVGIGNTDVIVTGDMRVTGILTVGSSSLTLDGTNDVVNVGTALTLGHTQGVQFHTQNLHSDGFEVNNINASGVITATSFVGDGANLTGLQAGYFEKTDAGINTSTNLGIGTTNPTSALTVSGDANITGVVTATSFVGNMTGDATGLSGSPSITVTDITASGNVSIAGTLTYEDVTNVDSVGLITARSGVDVTGNITVTGTVDGRDVATDGSKLDGIESGATADQTAAEIRTLVESATDSNVFTDADHTKLDGIESNATADQTASEILTSIKTVDGAGSGLDADTVDGVQGASFLRSDADDAASGQIKINDGSANPLELERSSQVGIEFNDTSVGSRYLGVNSGNLYYGSNLNHGINSKVWHAGNDGSGTGLDADTVDGIQATSFLRSDVSDSYTGSQLIFTSTGVDCMHYGGEGWQVSSSDAAYQRVDARDDGTNYSRLHWYGVSDSGATSNFRHAYYDGAAYINVTSSSSTLNFQRTTGTASLQVHGNTVWHAGNDGSGSGLDADTLDGINSGSFLRSNANDSASGTLTFTNTVTIDHNTGPLLKLSATNSSPWVLELHRDDIGSSRVFEHNPGNGVGWVLEHVPYFYASGNYYVPWHSGNDGSGSGLDADLLDGKHHTNFGATLATYGTTAGASGRIRCTAPFNTNSGHMFQVTVSIYSSYQVHTYVVGGYMYSSTNQWYSPTCIYTGNGSPDIYVGRDANGKAYISIANGSYTGVRVHNMTLGYYTNATDIYDPWTITIDGGNENSASVTTSTVWHAGNDGSGSGLDADTLDGINSASFLRSDADDNTTGKLVIGGNYTNNAYNSVSSTRLLFGGGNDQNNYFIGTNLENYGGNYTKLDLRWHTGIRMGAQPSYGGTRIFNNEDLSTLLFSVGRGDGNTRVESGALYITGNTAWHAGNDGSGSGLDADTVDGMHASSFLTSGDVKFDDDDQLHFGTSVVSGGNYPLRAYYSSSETLTRVRMSRDVVFDFEIDGDTIMRLHRDVASEGCVIIGTSTNNNDFVSAKLFVNEPAYIGGLRIHNGRVVQAPDGYRNSIIGDSARTFGSANGSDNTCIGYAAGRDMSTGVYNTQLGSNSQRKVTSGSYGTYVGAQAGYNKTTGNNCTAIGYRADYYLQNGNSNTTYGYTNTTCLGNDSRISGSNQVQLGNSSTTTYAYGSVQNRSDARDKTDIRDTLLGLDFINRLRPVDFRWDYRDDYFDEVSDDEDVVDDTDSNNVFNQYHLEPVSKDGSRSRTRFHHGLIAQEVKEVMDEIDIDFAGYQDHSFNDGVDVLTIGYTELIGPMIKAIQELKTENDSLRQRLDNAGL